MSGEKKDPPVLTEEDEKCDEGNNKGDLDCAAACSDDWRCAG